MPVKNRHTYKVHHGFTLLELTMVLFIISLLVSGFLVPLSQSVIQKERADTQEKLDEIKEALYGFTVSNGRLPCPDCRSNAIGNCPGTGTANDGIEDQDALGNCAADTNIGAAGNVVEGNLPWVTLGTSQYDAWQSWFTYGVSDFAADEIGSGTAGCAGTENTATLATCATGLITIIDKGAVPAVCPVPAEADVAQEVIAVVVSHGSNITRATVPAATPGLIDAPVLCSETENANQDANFVSSDFHDPQNNTNQFGIDDMIIWISPNVIKNKLIQAGRLP